MTDPITFAEFFNSPFPSYDYCQTTSTKNVNKNICNEFTDEDYITKKAISCYDKYGDPTRAPNGRRNLNDTLIDYFKKCDNLEKIQKLQEIFGSWKGKVPQVETEEPLPTPDDEIGEVETECRSMSVNNCDLNKCYLWTGGEANIEGCYPKKEEGAQCYDENVGGPNNSMCLSDKCRWSSGGSNSYICIETPYEHYVNPEWCSPSGESFEKDDKTYKCNNNRKFRCNNSDNNCPHCHIECPE